jgi:hypothetical protein
MFVPELPGWTKYCFVVFALGAPFVAAAPGCGEAFSGGATTSSGAAAATGGTHAGGAGALGGAGAEEPDAAEADVAPPPDSPEPDAGEDAGEADAPGPDGSEDAGECVLTCAAWWGACTDTESEGPCSPNVVCPAQHGAAMALLNCMCAECVSQCASVCQDPNPNCRYCYVDAGSYPECSEELAACLNVTT